MCDVEKLVNVVCEYLDSVEESKKYNLEVRKKKGLLKDSTLWIPSLDGSTAWRFGELFTLEQVRAWALADICELLDINQDRLVSAVKSMRRWEKHNGRYDRDTCFPYIMSYQDKCNLFQYLEN